MIDAERPKIAFNESELLGQALSLLQSGMTLLDMAHASMAAAYLDASILNIQSRLDELSPPA